LKFQNLIIYADDLVIIQNTKHFYDTKKKPEFLFVDFDFLKPYNWCITGGLTGDYQLGIWKPTFMHNQILLSKNINKLIGIQFFLKRKNLASAYEKKINKWPTTGLNTGTSPDIKELTRLVWLEAIPA